jgi:hypothetical protein
VTTLAGAVLVLGTKRHTPDGTISMPALGNVYSDGEIAGVVNYVTARFGGKSARMTAG